ncbi:ferric hydroxamate outer membrane receptor [Buttiauxella ferragutiae ATCC 51602]|jgi:iron complex outermembrane receptor protein|uniref:Ferric hydroxamate outer membrane receptor n=1 Tax=Buttiauxella ferragutiae ATCC 51602 TaxID=1354252 RepID=A0ABX2WE47_9ENTR|nr:MULTISPECIES: ferrichrome porin FhuA [Buttiauxella]AYN27497.1 ferrichrome porin FhuA [Buttiauxella sp. 3AFRM03]OAT33306.1 ferric hydroxamate outer membrane receptor [Buttiauxella ferragutiae ATCC 51602]TDN48018.1 iron complex outermembrane receptor protein [Buttiauxella sp. JUb87]UNK60594.1 ferrichrome porin FhuA [Buttiauxella ferragutiae]
MARLRTGQPVNTSIRKLAFFVAAAVSGVSASSFAADNTTAKEDTITVSASVADESAWGPSPTIAAKRTATATKTDTPIEKTPQSISIVTREEMDTHQPASVKEALGYTPGITVSTRGASDTYDAVKIRGFGSVNQNNYLDGLKLQGDFYNEVIIDPYMLERVELMRGPTSVLYGKSSPGGIITMVSKRPTTEPLKEVQFKMGTDNLWQTGFDFSDSLDDAGVYSYRLTGVARSNDDQQQFSKQKRYAIAPSFTWRPDDKTNFTFLANLQDTPETGYYGWLPKEGTVEPLPDGSYLPTDFNEGVPNNTYSLSHKMVGYTFDHEFNDTFTVRQNLRYVESKTNQKSVYGTGVDSSGYMLTRGTVVDNEKLHNFAVDTQVQSNFATGDVAHTLLTGVDFQQMRNDVNATFGSAPPLDLYNPVYENYDFGDADPYQQNKQKQTGIYIQDQAEWNKFVLTVGGRYDWLKQSTLAYQANNYTERDDSEFTGRAGLNYLFDNGVSPYISYSESFEPNSGADFYGNTFKPSKGRQYEAGVKYVPKDMAVVITGAIYQLTKSDNLMSDPDTSHGFSSIQGGEIRSRGVELEAKAAVNANINVTASYTYTDAEYTTDTNYKGNTPEQVPEHMASLWGDYTFNEGSLTGLTIGTGGRFIGSSYGDPANSFKVGSAAVLDAVVKYDLGRFGMNGSSVAVNVNNLLDREYVASCFATYGCFWGAERQVVATATFRF